jgi:hypothetical protein
VGSAARNSLSGESGSSEKTSEKLLLDLIPLVVVTRVLPLLFGAGLGTLGNRDVALAPGLASHLQWPGPGASQSRAPLVLPSRTPTP